MKKLFGAVALLGGLMFSGVALANAAPAALAPAHAPAAAPAPAAVNPAALANTITFAISDNQKRSILSIMGDGRIGPNPQWALVCSAVNQITPTQQNYSTLSMIRALVGAYDKPCGMPDHFPTAAAAPAPAAPAKK